MSPLEQVLLSLSDEEAEWAMCLTDDLFWSWIGEHDGVDEVPQV